MDRISKMFNKPFNGNTFKRSKTKSRIGRTKKRAAKKRPPPIPESYEGQLNRQTTEERRFQPKPPTSPRNFKPEPPVTQKTEKDEIVSKMVEKDDFLGQFCLFCKEKFEDSVSRQQLVDFGLLKVLEKVEEGNLEEEEEGNNNEEEFEWKLEHKSGLLFWTRKMTFSEKSKLLKQILQFSKLEVDAATKTLKEDFNLTQEDIESLTSIFKDKEITQIYACFKAQDAILNLKGFSLHFQRSGDARFDKVDDFVVDPEQFSNYGVEDFDVSAEEVCKVASKSLTERLKWVQKHLRTLLFEDEYDGPLRVRVQRESLLEKAADWINALHKEKKWRTTRYEFIGEPAFDSGGVAKEWYRLVAESVFQAEFGLFKRTSGSGQDISYDLNPDSGLFQPERHMFYFKFAGRLMAKALLEGCFIDAHLQSAIYKHLVRRPVSYKDLRFIDVSLYDSLRYMLEEASAEDIESLALTFSVTVDNFGAVEERNLKEDGVNIEVKKENLREYCDLITKYYLYGRYESQLEMFLKGFTEILPPHLFMVFSEKEFETLVCGESSIDIEDFKANVDYLGKFKGLESEHETVEWFWEILSEGFDESDKRKMLQFITGSSRVPIGGFAAFDDGKSMKISIEGISQKQSVFPRAHTCFNKLELPTYSSKSELEARLRDSIEYVNGFNLE